MSRWDVDAFAQKDFVQKLERAESYAKRSNLLTEWEQEFISDLRTKFDSREDADDLGLKRWEPSAKQLNCLDDIVRGL